MNRSTRAHLQAHLDEAAELLQADSEPDEAGAAVGPVISEWGRVLVARWKILLVGTLLAPICAAAVLLPQPRTYVADTLVVPTRTRTQVQFEPTIKTSTDSDPTQSSATSPTLTPERRQALVDLVMSGELESQVMQQLQGKIDANLLQSGKLAGHVKGVLLPKSEIIAVEAETTNPTDSIAIANAWATNYVTLVNRIYAGTDTGGTVAALEVQRDQAAAENDAAQATLVAAMKDSRLEQEQREIADKEHQLALWESAYQAGAFTDPIASQISTANGNQTPTLNKSVDTEMARNDYRLAEVRTLNDFAGTIRRLDSTKQTLQSLRRKTEVSGVGAGDTAALTLLKTQLVALSDALPAQMQFQLPPSTNSDVATDFQQLEASIDEARAATQREFDARRIAYEAKRDQQVQELHDALRGLRADVEALAAQRSQVTLKRDLASSSYNALARKVVERKVAEATMGQEVELAGRAASAVPAPNTRLLMTLVVAALVGFTLSVVVALFQPRSAPKARQREDVLRGGEAAPAAS